jgi:hypothetical protein
VLYQLVERSILLDLIKNTALAQFTLRGSPDPLDAPGIFLSFGLQYNIKRTSSSTGHV